MVFDKYTTVSRSLTDADFDAIIFASHATVPVVITILHDKFVGITDDLKTPVIALIRKGDAAASFTAGPGVVLKGPVPTAEKDGNAICVVRHGVVGASVEWGYL